MGLPVPAEEAEVGAFDRIVFHRRHASFNAGVLESTLKSVVPPLVEDGRTLMLVDEFEAITEPGRAANLLNGLVTLTVDPRRPRRVRHAPRGGLEPAARGRPDRRYLRRGTHERLGPPRRLPAAVRYRREVDAGVHRLAARGERETAASAPGSSTSPARSAKRRSSAPSRTWSGRKAMTDDDSAASDDPGRIRSIAVHRDDVSTALEATLRSDREVVLRVTPPFSGGGCAPACTTSGQADRVRLRKQSRMRTTRKAPTAIQPRYTSIREISLSMSHHTRRSTRRWRTTRTPT